MTHKRARTGRFGEELALSHLLRGGHKLLERNYRTRFGEIDLVTMDGDILVFTEVRTRSSSSFGTPLESVTLAKIHRLRRLAQAYIAATGQSQRCIRFDVIGVKCSAGTAQIEHVEGAF